MVGGGQVVGGLGQVLEDHVVEQLGGHREAGVDVERPSGGVLLAGEQLDGAHGQPVTGQTPAHVQVQGDEPGDVGHEDHAAQGGAGRAGVQGPHRGVLHHQGDRLHAGLVRSEGESVRHSGPGWRSRRVARDLP